MAEKGKAAEITKKDMNKKIKQNTFRTCFLSNMQHSS